MLAQRQKTEHQCIFIIFIFIILFAYQSSSVLQSLAKFPFSLLRSQVALSLPNKFMTESSSDITVTTRLE
ncbi:hypothetical protein FWK35_00022332 [Aphis craccivora]|uniref:Uncharacterized protein n=1 Tax=Aphis craccivora TaxID=307492 RepID=A0A6G0YNR1_APHCR|nr:hypothetical protein FWK35_00022332 [Aphis craccivora]